VIPLLRVKHAGNLFAPGMQRVAELYQWGEPATTEHRDVPQKTVRQAAAAFLRLAFLQQQITESLFEAVNRLQRRVLPQVRREALLLRGGLDLHSGVD
jgi:serine phosphatase RsbU (regulator of sigma subunit)